MQKNSAKSQNTLKAYRADWAHFTRWCRQRGTEPLPPIPERIGLYLTDLAASQSPHRAVSASTIERRLSGLIWNAAQRGFVLDRRNPKIATALAELKQKDQRRPKQKEAILPAEIQAMAATLPFDLRGLRDRAILLLGYAGGLRRSEIVGLDFSTDDTPDSRGWVEMFEAGLLLALRGKKGLHTV